MSRVNAVARRMHLLARLRYDEAGWLGWREYGGG